MNIDLTAFNTTKKVDQGNSTMTNHGDELYNDDNAIHC